ncbi:MAG: AI-2E family transporter [Erysipelotrichaceae bacterium]
MKRGVVMLKDDYSFVKTVLIVIIGILSYWCLNNLSAIFAIISKVVSCIMPFIVGFVIAYILNIPMKKFESMLGKKIKDKPKLVRMISIVLALLLMVVIVLIVLLLLIPELVENITTLIDSLSTFAKTAEGFIIDLFDRYPELQSQISSMFSQFSDVTKIVSNLLSSLVNSMVSFLSSLFSGFMLAFTSVIFSIYMLAQKEYLLRGCKKVVYAFLTKEKADKVLELTNLINSTFSKFVSGQCIEVVILGTMMFIACSIFRFPYALIIAVLTTITALIPIFGALVAMVIGFILIAISSLLQGLLFIVVFQVVQQIENNFIYPKVVGKSVGLYPIWTLLAITVGGNLFGVVGMLCGLPLASVIYVLFKQIVQDKLNNKKLNVE